MEKKKKNNVNNETFQYRANCPDFQEWKYDY